MKKNIALLYLILKYCFRVKEVRGNVRFLVFLFFNLDDISLELIKFVVACHL